MAQDIFDTTPEDLRASMLVATSTDPEAHAKVVNLANKLQLPPELVARNPQWAQHQSDLMLDAEKLTKDYPGTAKFLSDPNRAAVSRDEIIQQMALEDTVRNAQLLEPGLFGKDVRDAIAKQLREKGHKVEIVDGSRPVSEWFPTLDFTAGQEVDYSTPGEVQALQGVGGMGITNPAQDAQDEQSQKMDQKAVQLYSTPQGFWERMITGAANMEPVPFVGAGKEMVDVYALTQLANRVKDGTADDNDWIELLKYDNEIRRGTDFGGKVAAVLVNLPAFAGEIAATGGLYTTGSQAARKAGLYAAKKILNKSARDVAESAVLRGVVKTAGWVAGSAVQATVGMPHRVAVDAMKRMVPQLSSMSVNEQGELEKLVLDSEDGFASAIGKAILNQSIEVGTESAGAFIGKVTGLEALKSAVVTKWFKLNPTKGWSQFSALLRKAKWDGVLEEFGEERLGEILRAVTGLEKMKLDPEQYAVELVSFAALPMAGAAVYGPGMVRQSRQLAERAQTQVEFFRDLGAQSSESKTRTRVPGMLGALGDLAAQDGPVERVFAPIAAWDQYFASKGIDPRQVAQETLGETESYDKAREAGHDLEIPIGAYTEKLAPTEHNEALAQVLRLGSADAPNVVEMQAGLQATQASVEEMLKLNQDYTALSTEKQTLATEITTLQEQVNALQAQAEQRTARMQEIQSQLQTQAPQSLQEILAGNTPAATELQGLVQEYQSLAQQDQQAQQAGARIDAITARQQEIDKEIARIEKRNAEARRSAPGQAPEVVDMANEVYTQLMATKNTSDSVARAHANMFARMAYIMANRSGMSLQQFKGRFVTQILGSTKNNAAAPAGVTMSQEEQQRDAAYMAAVESGDIETAQRLVDEAAKAAGYTTKVFHGTDADFTVPNMPLFLGDEDTADAYAKDRAAAFGDDVKPMVYRFYARFANTASEEDVKQVAKELGLEVENDMAFSVLDPQISPGKAPRVVDELKRKGYDSAQIDDFVVGNTTDVVQSFVAFDARQLKSAEPVTRDADGNVIPLSERFDEGQNSILYQDETLAEVDREAKAEAENDQKPEAEIVQKDIPAEVDQAANYESAFKLASSKTWERGRDLKLAMQDALLAAATKHEVDVSRQGPQTTEYLIRVGLSDALAALKQNPNAIGWYDKKTRQALAAIALVHPEVGTDENARFAFVWALAVTSNGLKVGKNFELAEKAYSEYKRTGVMPTNIQAGNAQKAINDTLGLFNQLKDLWGIDNLRLFMQTNFTVGEISSLDKELKPGGEWADTVVRGAAILGPKIGNGFFSNLYGFFDALTMDRWLIRTWGRWTGTLVILEQEKLDAGRNRLAQAISALSKEDAARIAAALKLDAIPSDLDEAAKRLVKASMKKDLRDSLNETPAGEQVRLAGNSLAKYLDGQKEAPKGPAERNYIRAVFGQVLAELQTQDEYKDLTMADLQAVLWYGEKRLYEFAKEDAVDGEDAEGYEDDEAPDYANAAAAVAREKGVPDRKIKAAFKRIEEDGRTTGTRRDDGEAQSGQEPRQQAQARGFAESERKQFKQTVAVKRIRLGRGGSKTESFSYTRRSLGDGGRPKALKKFGVQYVAEIRAGSALRRILRNAGETTVDEKGKNVYSVDAPHFVELVSDANSATKFAGLITASKASKKFGAAVYVYPEADYQGMRMFLAEDGSSGFALKPDGDIVSVFSDGGSGRAALEAAIAMGGRKLDAFDTILPYYYAAHGFVVASRLKWDDSQMPSDWSKEAFKKFNNGEPDVVFMALDPQSMRGYDKSDGRAVKDYDSALRQQKKALKDIEQRAAKAKEDAAQAEEVTLNQSVFPEMTLNQNGDYRPGVLTEAAQKFKAGEITREEYNRIAAVELPLTPFKSVPKPATMDEVRTGLGEYKAGTRLKRDMAQAPEDIPAQTLESRLDIPAYREKGVWVVTLHEDRGDKSKGSAASPIAYTSTAMLNNVTFKVHEAAALNIATGKPKGTIATMRGDYQPMTANEAQALAEQAMQDGWVQVGMNPLRHSFFYDKADERPVVSAEQVLQIGGLVLAKNPVYGNTADYLFQRAFHGSPHKFEKFMLEHIGTGEGAQAYGWGLYFAGNREVAEYYRETISTTHRKASFLELTRSGLAEVFGSSREFSDEEVRQFSYAAFGDFGYGSYDGPGDAEWEDERALRRDARNLWTSNRTLRDIDEAKIREAIQSIRSGVNRGKLYEVEIPENDVLLDWDKPLSEQPKAVLRAIKRMKKHEVYGQGVKDALSEDMHAQDFYNYLAGDSIGAQYVSEALNEEGIKGIRYLDQGSRSDGEGTHNFVIFDDTAIEMLRTFYQNENNARGAISFNPAQRGAPRREFTIRMLKKANASTFMHEAAHFYLEVFNDLANQADAPQGLRDDWDRISKWLGLQAGVPITVDQHETFARGFERYLMEGKAPAEEVRGFFASMRTWLVRIYRDLMNLNVDISEDIRGVFDRMVATDVEIEAAQAREKVEPMFGTKPDGMDEAAWERYRKAVESASLQARERLQTELEREMLKAKSDERKAEIARVTQTVRSELAATREHIALAILRSGKMPDDEPIPEPLMPMKLDRDSLLSAGFDKDTIDALRKLGVYRVEDGVSVDVAAEVLGFGSADELVQALVSTPSFDKAVKEETKRRVDASHPSIMEDSQEIKRAASDAVRNDKRDEVIAVEVEELQRLIRADKQAAGRVADLAPAPLGAIARRILRSGPEQANAARILLDNSKVTVDFIKAMATKVAQEQLQGMKLRDIRPSLYLAAARAAGARASRLAAAGDFQGALGQKESELLNHILYRESRDMQKVAQKQQRYLLRMTEDAARERLGKANPSYREQVDGILERFNFVPIPLSQVDRRTRLAEWISAQEAKGLTVDIDETVRDEAFRKDFREMTAIELTAVWEAVKQIDHLAKTTTRLLTLQDEREFRAVVQDLVAQITANTKAKPRGFGSKTSGEKIAEGWDSFFAAHRKLASLVREMDGFVDAGPVYNAIMAPINDAGDNEAVETEKATEAIQKLFKVFEKDELKRMTRKQVVRGATKNFNLSREDVLSIALNWGNEDNRQKLVDGYNGLTEQDVIAILDTMTEKEWKFVQSVWDYIDSFWPRIRDKQERVYGIPPDKIEPTPVVTKFGVFKGGYYPLKYAGARAEGESDADAAKMMMRGAVTSSTTRRGHTKERVAGVERPVRLDLGVLTEHVTQVVHDLTHHEMLVDVNRILRNRSVMEAIEEHYGEPVYRQLRKALEAIAVGNTNSEDRFTRALGHIRTGASVAGLGFNLMTSMLQAFGLTNAIPRVGAVNMAKAVGRWIGSSKDMEDSIAWIYERSDMMRLRGKTMNRELNEIRNTVDPKFQTALMDSYFYLIQKGQMLADVPTWLGAYHRAMDAKSSEDEAVRIADQTVIDTQGGGMVKDLANVQRGGPLLKMWTTFYSYFNALWNLNVETVKRTNFKSPTDMGRMMVDLLILNSLPVAIQYALVTAMRGGAGGDDDEWYKALAKQQMSYLLAQLVFVRELGGIMDGRNYEGPAGGRFFAESYKLAKQVEQGELDRGFWVSANKVGGILFHYPAVQAQRTVEGMKSLWEGKTFNPAVLIVGPSREER